MGLVQEIIAVIEGSFSILVNRYGDCLGMRVAPPFPRRSVPDFRERGFPGRVGLGRRYDLQQRDIPFYLQDFVDRHESAIATSNCRCA